MATVDLGCLVVGHGGSMAILATYPKSFTVVENLYFSDSLLALDQTLQLFTNSMSMDI